MEEEEQSRPKRKRLHLDLFQSVRLSQSEEGTASLRRPVDRTHPRAMQTGHAMAPGYCSRHEKRPASLNQEETYSSSSTALGCAGSSKQKGENTKLSKKSTDSIDKSVKRKTLKRGMDPHQGTSTCSSSSLLHLDEKNSTSASPCVPSVRTDIEVGPTFGLLNDSVVERVEVNCFEELPRHIVENILCRLPVSDLCLSVNRVCVSWHNIVSSFEFMPWKKLYHRMKKGDRQSMDQMKSFVLEMAESHGNEDPDWFNNRFLPVNSLSPGQADKLLWLIRYMMTFKRADSYNDAGVILQRHPKYRLALALLESKTPQCIENGEPNPWSLICAVVLVSATVEDVHQALRLLTSYSKLRNWEVLECFYCINTYLLYWKYTAHQLYALGSRCPSVTSYVRMASEVMGVRRVGRQFVAMSDMESHTEVQGLHYRVFYALHLYENSFFSHYAMLRNTMVARHGQQSMIRYSLSDEKMGLTHEQLRIISYTPELKSKETIKVFGYAGTGKTTVLLRYTQMRPHLKFLLIASNKSVCTQAQNRFPPNVTCKTAHNLARRVTGRKYFSQKKLDTKNLQVYDVAMALRAFPQREENLFIRAKFVVETLKNFLSSKDEEITTSHVPLYQRCNEIIELIPHSQQMLYAEDAACYWYLMKSLLRVNVKMTPDGYLKLYQLGQPTLEKYDIILVDEAHDLTPAIVDILSRQVQPKIFVGDRHQQTCAFSGDVNVMGDMHADKIFYLTQSFQFGPEIAHVVNTIQENLKHETTNNIVGHWIGGTINGEQVGQEAVLCHNKLTLFREAFGATDRTASHKRVAIVGGLDSLGVSTLRDMYTLMLPEEDRKKGNLKINDKFIACFKNLAELQRYASKTLDVEMGAMVRIVYTCCHRLPELLDKIEAKIIADIQQADVVLSMVHNAKGLQFPTVRIANDFLGPDLSINDILCYGAGMRHVEEEDANMLCLAVTRAKHALIMSDTLWRMFMNFGGGGFYPVLTEDLQRRGVKMKCLNTKKRFNPQTITVYRPRVTLAHGQTLQAGVLSPAELDRDYAGLFGDHDPDPDDDGHNPDPDDDLL